MKRNKGFRNFQAIQARRPEYLRSQKTESDLKAALFAQAFQLVKAPAVSETTVEVLSDTPVIEIS